MNMNFDRQSVAGAMQRGFPLARIARALGTRVTSLQSVLASQGQLTEPQRRKLESLTGLSTAELAINVIRKEASPAKRRENRELDAITKELLRELRPIGRNGHASNGRRRKSTA